MKERYWQYVFIGLMITGFIMMFSACSSHQVIEKQIAETTAISEWNVYNQGEKCRIVFYANGTIDDEELVFYHYFLELPNWQNLWITTLWKHENGILYMGAVYSAYENVPTYHNSGLDVVHSWNEYKYFKVKWFQVVFEQNKIIVDKKCVLYDSSYVYGKIEPKTKIKHNSDGHEIIAR